MKQYCTGHLNEPMHDFTNLLFIYLSWIHSYLLHIQYRPDFVSPLLCFFFFGFRHNFKNISNVLHLYSLVIAHIVQIDVTRETNIY